MGLFFSCLDDHFSLTKCLDVNIAHLKGLVVLCIVAL